MNLWGEIALAIFAAAGWVAFWVKWQHAARLVGLVRGLAVRVDELERRANGWLWCALLWLLVALFLKFRQRPTA